MADETKMYSPDQFPLATLEVAQNAPLDQLTVAMDVINENAITSTGDAVPNKGEIRAAEDGSNRIKAGIFPAEKSKFHFATSDLGDLLGKTEGDLSDGVVIKEGESIRDQYAVGTLKHVTGYTGFSSETEEQEGYYLAFKVVGAPADKDVTVKGTKKDAVLKPSDRTCVMFLGSSFPFKNENLPIFVGEDLFCTIHLDELGAE